MLLEVYAPFEEAQLKTGQGRRMVAKRLLDMDTIGVRQIELAAGKEALTPSPRMANFVRKRFGGFLNIMVNGPGSGAGGSHTMEEKGEMLNSLRALRGAADGFVVGVSMADGSLDVDTVARMASIAKGRKLTYILDGIAPHHRVAALADLKALGFSSVLTSGGYYEPMDGIRYEGRIDTHLPVMERITEAARELGMTAVLRGGIKSTHFTDPEIGPRLARLDAVHARFDREGKGKAFNPQSFEDACYSIVLDHRGSMTPASPRRRGLLAGLGVK